MCNIATAKILSYIIMLYYNYTNSTSFALSAAQGLGTKGCSNRYLLVASNICICLLQHRTVCVYVFICVCVYNYNVAVTGRKRTLV